MITVSDFPKYRGTMEYVCLGCGARFDIRELYYTCPHCSGVFLLEDTSFDSLLEFPPSYWQGLFDKRAATRVTALRGVLRFYELMAPVMDEEDIVYLGEGHTPMVAANAALTELVGVPPTVYREQSADATDGIPACLAKNITRPIRNREAQAAGRT